MTLVSLLILGEFGQPIGLVALREGGMQRAAVPETAIVNVPLLTVGTSEVRAKVPVVAGSVRTVPVPATAFGISCAVPEVAPGNVMLEMPVSAWLADARFSATAVVPTYAVELPSTAEGIVPLRLPAVRLVKFAPDTAPNEADQVPEVTVPVVVRLDEPASGDAPTVL